MPPQIQKTRMKWVGSRWFKRRKLSLIFIFSHNYQRRTIIQHQCWRRRYIGESPVRGRILSLLPSEAGWNQKIPHPNWSGRLWWRRSRCWSWYWISNSDLWHFLSWKVEGISQFDVPEIQTCSLGVTTWRHPHGRILQPVHNRTSQWWWNITANVWPQASLCVRITFTSDFISNDIIQWVLCYWTWRQSHPDWWLWIQTHCWCL